MAELYRLTQYRKKQLGINYPGYKIVEMWEHNWRRTWKELSDGVKERIDVTRCTEAELKEPSSIIKSTGMGKLSAT